MQATDMSSHCHASEKCVRRHGTRGVVWSCVCLFPAEAVSDLVSNPTKVQRVASCHKSCAQLVVSMLEPSMQPMRLEDC